ncbi:MAG: hypothetical protein ACLU9S_19620 [Oscillospiraceae bacterium]
MTTAAWILSSEPDTSRAARSATRCHLSSHVHNHNDGFLYGMEMVQSYETWNYLVRVNPVNGEVLRLCELDMNTYGYAFGNMAIDHDGNFYIISIDITNYKTMLVKFRLVNDEVNSIETASLADWARTTTTAPWYLAPTMASSGLMTLHSRCGWDFCPSMGNGCYALAISGRVPEYGATNMGLLEIPDEEPSVPFTWRPAASTWLTATCCWAGGAISVGLVREPECPGGRRLPVKDPGHHRHMVDEYGMSLLALRSATTLGAHVEALARDPGGQYNGNLPLRLVRLPVV